jgi:hypothetical protein
MAHNTKVTVTSDGCAGETVHTCHPVLMYKPARLPPLCAVRQFDSDNIDADIFSNGGFRVMISKPS